ncbi:MAG: hypothetical protein IT221_16500, partial [Fluviicola sp.]|nr:hypothetical protein [Fluviicola sp.]
MKQVIIAFTSLFLSSVSIAQNQKDLIHKTANVNSIEKLEAYNKHLQNSQQQLVFQENKGQVSDQNFHSRPDVLFSGQSNGMVFHLKNKGISYQLNRVYSYKEVKDESTGEMRSEIDQSTIYRIDINWLNTNGATRVKKENVVKGFNNYYLEHCPNGALNVLSYENVFYENIYNGIDLKWYSNNGSLKYDYLVAAGADYQQIVFEIEGAESIVVNEKGQLVIKTPLGTIMEESPYVIQEGKELKSQWVINNNRIHFNIENIDASKPFIIDPVVRQWGTYYGGSNEDIGISCVVDLSNSVYLTGYSTSSLGTTIATSGSHQNTFGGFEDAFLVNFNSLGARQWGTYYGGFGSDRGYSCAVDASGNVCVAGITTSNSAIASPGSHQTVYGGLQDAFLAKFNSSGIRLWGTYYGGANEEEGNSCAIDALGNIFVVGHTESNSNIATIGSHQNTLDGITRDAFLVKFSSSGIRQWGTYYGGASTDDAFTCAIDQSGNIYFAGYSSTIGGNSIATLGSHQSTHGGGSLDAYLVKFNSLGVRQWGTYYGGSGFELGIYATINTIGDIYLCGRSSGLSGSAIATIGSHQSSNFGADDAFLVKFNSSGVRQWGTYYGGLNNDVGYSCVADASGNVYLTGITESSSIGTDIATLDGYQTTFGGGSADAFLVKFNSTGIRQWGTFYGGSESEFAQGSAIDAFGRIYISGRTQTTTGTTIATLGSHQSVYGGGNGDAFLAKFIDCAPNSGTASITSCNPITWIDGNTYSTSNSTATHTLTNTAGCDSIVTLNFTRLMPTSGTATITSCNPITWIDGNTYSTSNSTATHTLTNAAGCDSVVTLNYILLLPTSGTAVISSCDPITWIDGNTYSTSNSTATHTLTNAVGCDSIITLNYTRLLPTSGTAVISSCDPITWIDGNTYSTSTNTPTFTLTNAAGCDSVVTLNLTINSVSNLSTSLSG